MRVERLNRLGAINDTRRYLEIGVFRGETFFPLPFETKVGVDPAFAFPLDSAPADGATYHQLTSNAFFATTDEAPFDLIYIDGLHTFEQTLEDFLSSIRLSHARTIWLIDDTCPDEYFSTLRDQKASQRIRASMGSKAESWMGDVYKLVYFVHDFMQEFSYCTFAGHGQTVLWREKRTDGFRYSRDLEHISRLTYAEHMDTRDAMFMFKADEDIYAAVERGLHKS